MRLRNLSPFQILSVIDGVLARKNSQLLRYRVEYQILVIVSISRDFQQKGDFHCYATANTSPNNINYLIICVIFP